MTHPSWGGPGVSQANLVRILGVGGLPLYVRREVAVIHQHLANNLPKLRQPGAPALSSSGGYNKRYISGTTTWSNHAWALAVDYNAATNPYSRNGTTDFKVAETRALCHSLDFMRWGWDYSGKKDAMHFEWIGSPSQAAITTQRLLGETVVDSKAFSVGAHGDKVIELELRLNLLGLGNFTPDGGFDATTAKAVLAFQKLAFPNDPKAQDGIAGKNTLAALEHWPLRLTPVIPNKGFSAELSAGQTLYPGQTVISENKKYTLAMQTDGNVVLYSSSGVVWSTGIRGTHFSMQTDGNAVLYLTDSAITRPVWQTNTAGIGLDPYFAVQNDGNLVVYGTRAYWSTR